MIYSIFYILFLKLYYCRLNNVCEYPKINLIIIKNKKKYKIDKILNKRKIRGKPQYYI